MIKLCIFDLDGTTVDSLRSIAYFANETLSSFNIEPFDIDDFRHLAGGGAKKLMTNILTARSMDASILDDLVSDWLSRYEKRPFYLTEPYPDIDQMLAALKGLGIITTIVTNKSQRVAASIIDHAFGKPGVLIDASVSEHPGMKLKPAPDELLNLCEKYSVSPIEAMYIGDHAIDMKTGKNAGVTACGVTWGFHARDELTAAGADIIADTPNDIVEYVKSSFKENQYEA